MSASRRARLVRSPRGGVAVALVIALVILQLVVVGMVVAGARDQSLVVHRAESLRTLYAAEAGAQMGLRELAVGADEDGDGTIGSISAGGAPGAGLMLLGARISATLELTDSTSGELVSRGAASEAARSIRLAFALSTESAGGAGLAVDCYALSATPTSLSSVDWDAPPSATGPVPFVHFASIASSSNAFWNTGPTTRYGVRLTGTLQIPQAGNWTFTLGSDAGSALFINGEQIIDHDGAHSFSTRTGTVSLAAGPHELAIRFFESTGSHGLTLAWQGPGVPVTTVVPPSALSLTAGLADEFPPIAVADAVYVWGDDTGSAASIDGFDASAGAYGGANVLTDRLLVATNATGSQRVQLSGRASIQGRAQIGPGGNPATVVAAWGGSEITGGVAARPVALGIHRGLEPYAPMPSSEGSRTWTSSQTINSNRRFQDLSVWGNGTVVTVSGNVTLLCDGNVTIGDRVEFRLDPGASLALFVRGDVNIDNRAQINMNTGDPGRCWIHMLGVDRRLQLTERAAVAAHVRNPRGSFEMSGQGNPGSEFYGTFHGRTFAMSDKTRFHADVSQYGGSGGAEPGQPAAVTVAEWAADP